MLKGDISGIQEYIFNVASKGAAKTLHEHSVNIMKIEEKYKNALKDKLGISDAKIFKGGGGFHVTFEKSDGVDIEKLINNYQSQINSELEHSQLSVRLSYGCGDTFEMAWKDLVKKNNDKRYRLYGNINEDLCNKLFKPFKKEDISSFENNIASISVAAVENLHWTKELMESIEEIDLNKEQKKLYENINNKDKKNNMPLIDFDGYASFAELRTGTDFLGVLKMDVDNLGKLFAKCKTIDEFEKKSEFFNTFFGKEKIEELLNQTWLESWTYHQNIYSVYTGGDDCFFIGAWDAIFDFANVIHTEFEKQVKEEPNTDNITLSAGIVLLDANTPVVQLGKMAEEALSEAKKRKVEIKTVKNAICLMNEVFTWEDYKGIMEQTETLTEFLTDKKITRGILEKIKKSSIGFDRLQQRIRKGETLPFDRVYKLKYYIRDVKKEYADDLEKRIFHPYIDALTKILTNKSQAFSENYINPMRFPMAARLAEFKTRNLKNNTNE
ncbi:MAG: hypothetical protein JJE17_03160 [Peptostreptococcaceae bacterium]|nr:hypothetical protein [Peptostreptococcaceae bacterium]